MNIQENLKLQHYLEPALKGSDIGIMSEAGFPELLILVQK